MSSVCDNSWKPKVSLFVTVSHCFLVFFTVFWCFTLKCRESRTFRVSVKLCRFVGKPRLLLIQQRNFWDFLGKLQEKVRISLRTF